ncbi:MAG: peptide-methionine (R)-S-oxide reductase MsrB [Lysobacteraceae bacterium]
MTQSSTYDLTPLPAAQREALARRLSPEQRRILLAHGTQAPFCGGLLDNKLEGIYACALCGLPLFSSAHKFDSGSGWPSFHRPFHPSHIMYLRDESHGMVRVEIRCARCDGHLGHVFPDGPPPTHERYCLNSEAMAFFPEGQMPPQHEAQA